MQIGEALDVIRTQHHAVLATRRRDGTPAMTPVLANVDAAGRVIISSRETTQKVRNLRRDPRAWLCVLPDRFFGRWVQVEGKVEIVALPEAMEPLVDYYRRTAGEHPDWVEYRAAMESDQRVLIRLAVTRAGQSAGG
jgi:PPOX class probable F420-dependent enzyme